MFLASNGVFVLVTLNPNVLIFCLLKFSTVATATLSCSLSNDFNVSNIVTIQVGDQVPYEGMPFEIPGTIEAGLYDKFEGGVGQNISYLDMSQINEGDFRTNEYVDAASVNNEGVTVGWNSAGEWLEYSINVETAGMYNLSFRYASGNSNGGGPFHFEVDGNTISPAINMQTTNDWNSWSTKNITNIELRQGEQVLRLFIDAGEFNVGEMIFSYAGALPYSPPIADAGENVKGGTGFGVRLLLDWIVSLS